MWLIHLADKCAKIIKRPNSKDDCRPSNLFSLLKGQYNLWQLYSSLTFCSKFNATKNNHKNKKVSNNRKLTNSFPILFLYPLKTPENLSVFCFQGVEKGSIGIKWVKLILRSSRKTCIKTEKYLLNILHINTHTYRHLRMYIYICLSSKCIITAVWLVETAWFLIFLFATQWNINGIWDTKKLIGMYKTFKFTLNSSKFTQYFNQWNSSHGISLWEFAASKFDVKYANAVKSTT